MKTFLETWLEEAPKIFLKELSADAVLGAAEQLPAATNGISLAVTVSGARSGRFAVLIERAELHALLIAANVAEPGDEAPWEGELWQGLIDQAAKGVAGGIAGMQVGPAAAESWTLGLPAAAYQLTLGETVMRVAFADLTEAPPEVIREAAPSSSSQVASGQTGSSTSHSEPTDLPRAGVDLLLDVELEASLRFGSREMLLNEVLDLGPGDVIALDRHIAEPVDLLVGDKIVARGEVVLVNGNFGFSVLEVAAAEKRLESIRCLF
jgi:flagellar motor switch protein FliN